MRKQFNHIVFGGNGSGKTTFLIKIAVNYIKANPKKRVLFLVPDDGEEKLDPVPEKFPDDLKNFKGIAKLIIDSDKIFKELLNVFSDKEHKFNGLIICDDLGVIIGRRPENILKLFKRRRQANIDFLWSFHGFNTEMPRSFFTYVNKIFIFETSDNHEWTKKLLPVDKQEEFEKTYQLTRKDAVNDIKYKCRELLIRKSD